MKTHFDAGSSRSRNSRRSVLRKRLGLEQLEDRRVMAADIQSVAGNGEAVLQKDILVDYTTVLKNTSGNIEIRAADTNNHFKVSRSESNIVIDDTSSSANQQFIISGLSGVNGAVISPNKKSVSIPFTTIHATGSPLLINTNGGDDQIQLDTKNLFTNSFIPLTGLKLDLGDGQDRLELANNATNNFWSITSARGGKVDIGQLGSVDFNGIEVAQGGAGTDDFTIAHAQNIFEQVTLDGGDGLKDSIRATRDANFLLGATSLLTTTSTLQQSYLFANIENATITGGAGNNFLNAKNFLGSSVLNGADGNDVLWGGVGNDLLNGGNGNDWLSGNDGNDVLLGYAGRDILIGGKGSDQLNNAQLPATTLGDDILIGGTTSFDVNKAAIDAMLFGWGNPYTYTGHINQFKNVGVGSTHQYKLNSTTVFDDAAADKLAGGSGNDWFFAITSGTNKDTHDRAGIEQVVEL